MSSFTTILCYAIDAQLLSRLLNQTDSTALVEALRASGKQTSVAKRKLEQELAQHLPFLEKIMAGTPANDGDPFGLEEDDDDDEMLDDDDAEDEDEVSAEDDSDAWDDDDDDDDWDDDDEPFESEQYADAFEWLCERLGKPIPIPDSLYANSIVGYDYYGFTEALKRFQSPFPLPLFDDAGLLVGFIPNENLSEFKFKPIDPVRAAEIQEAVEELQSIAEDVDEFEDDDEDDGDEDDLDDDELDDDGMDFAGFMADRAQRDFAAPEQAQIELAHDELAAIFADIHQLGKDFVGIIRNVG